MTIYLLAGIPGNEGIVYNNCHVETTYELKSAISFYREMIMSGKYRFVYLTEVMDSHPSGSG